MNAKLASHPARSDRAKLLDCLVATEVFGYWLARA